MKKGKKRCHFCRCELNNQNKTQTQITTREHFGVFPWVECCHSCKTREEKKG